MTDTQYKLLKDLSQAIDVCTKFNPDADLASLLASLVSLTAGLAYQHGALEATSAAWQNTVDFIKDGGLDNVDSGLSSSN
jgi:hypothetical protein